MQIRSERLFTARLSQEEYDNLRQLVLFCEAMRSIDGFDDLVDLPAAADSVLSAFGIDDGEVEALTDKLFPDEEEPPEEAPPEVPKGRGASGRGSRRSSTPG